MSVVLHVSDPHFGTEVPEVVEALARLAGQLRPDLVVLSGDITQRARAAQFQAARAFIAGEHDQLRDQFGRKECENYLRNSGLGSV